MFDNTINLIERVMNYVRSRGVIIRLFLGILLIPVLVLAGGLITAYAFGDGQYHFARPKNVITRFVHLIGVALMAAFGFVVGVVMVLFLSLIDIFTGLRARPE